jgi:7-cyano-7-deazaguanine synthase
MRSIDSIIDTTLLPPAGAGGVHILSGGMDSVTLLHFLVRHRKCRMKAISFDYGQKHVKELEFAKIHCKELGVEHHIVELPFINTLFKSDLLQSGGKIPDGHYEEASMKQTVVPNRNMIMSAIAVGFGQSHGLQFLSLGVHAGDHAIYPDCRTEFIDAFRAAVQLSDWQPFTVFAPFQRMTKKEILEIGLQLMPPIDYAQTWTCYKGEEKPCGKCGACQERSEAFAEVGVKDPGN